MHAANFADLLQLRRAPDPANRVVGAAENEEVDVVFHNLALHILKIHGVSAVFVLEGVFHHPAAVAVDHIEELVVHRGMNQHRITGLGGHPDGGGQGSNHAGGLDNPAAVDGPAVATGEPAGDGLIIIFGAVTVSKNAPVHHFPQRILHAFGCGKVHIGHP